MTSENFDRYFDLAQANYQALIQELLDDTARLSVQPDSDELTQARSSYFTAAIIKGVELPELAQTAAALSIADLYDAAESFPDKESLGWYEQPISLFPGDRDTYEEMALQRPLDQQWDDLFAEGRNTIILPFVDESQTAQEQIDAYIRAHNRDAQRLFEEAVEVDRRAQNENPEARPQAGRAINQQQIRLLPPPQTKLEIYNAHKKKWNPGPKLAKFLQDQHEWKLYELVQRNPEWAGTQGKPSVEESAKPTGRYASLKAMATHKPVAADDEIPLNDLQVVISRNPQHVGEMSTGQRWHSCMARDGVNYDYVLQDLRQGTLIAYVTHKDDPEARYPLMRLLIRPFLNDHGEAALVPSHKIYGGEGAHNERTRMAFLETTKDFVVGCNQGKVGMFQMAKGLYADGQPRHVFLHREWTSDAVADAMMEYQDSNIQEDITEIKKNLSLIESEQTDQFGADPKENLSKLQKRLRRVFSCHDSHTGLARMFFRDVNKTNIGTLPNTSLLVDVARTDAKITLRNDFLDGLLAGDTSQAGRAKEQFSSQQYANCLFAAGMLVEPGSNEEGEVAQLYKQELKTMPVSDIVASSQNLILSSQMDQVGADVLKQKLDGIEGGSAQDFRSVFDLASDAPYGSLMQGSVWNKSCSLLKAIPDKAEQEQEARKVIHSFRLAEEDVLAKNVLCKEAYAICVDQINADDDPQSKFTKVIGLLQNIQYMKIPKENLHNIFWDVLDKVPDEQRIDGLKEYVDAADYQNGKRAKDVLGKYLANEKMTPPQNEEELKATIEKIAEIPTRKMRVDAALSCVEDHQRQPYKNELLDVALENVDGLPADKKFWKVMRIAAQYDPDHHSLGKAYDIAIEEMHNLAPEDRVVSFVTPYLDGRLDAQRFQQVLPRLEEDVRGFPQDWKDEIVDVIGNDPRVIGSSRISSALEPLLRAARNEPVEIQPQKPRPSTQQQAACAL